jgi:hypothetical protein
MVTDKQLAGRFEKLRQDEESHIREYGWSAMGVFPTEENDLPYEFLYTIGLPLKYLPELIVFGLPGHQAHSLMSAIVAKVTELDDKPRDGHVIDGIANVPFVLRDVPSGEAIEEFLIQSREFYRWADRNGIEDMIPPGGTESFPVMQVVWPDDEGRFPWDEGMREKWRVPQELIVKPWEAPDASNR